VGYSASAVELHADPAAPVRSRVQSLKEDPAGALWVGTHLHGIYRIAPDGRVDHCPDATPGANFVRDFYFPGDGSIWTAYLGGVAIFDKPPFPGRPVLLFGSREGLSIDTGSLVPGDDGGVLVGTSAGMTEIVRDARRGWRLGSTIDRNSGLPADAIGPLVRDTAGNLWAGIAARGLVKLSTGDFSTVAEAEQVGAVFVDLSTDRDGRIVTFSSKGAMSLSAFQPDGTPTGPFRLSLPRSKSYVGWGTTQKVLCDSRGSWWVATGGGLLRFDDRRKIGLSRFEHPPDAAFGAGDGLAGPDVFVVAEDSRGDVWISAQPLAHGRSSVSRWSRATAKIESFLVSATGTRSLASRFATARDGAVWITFLDQRVLRYRDGQFQRVEVTPGGNPGIEDMRVDDEGRLWIIGRTAYVCDDPTAAEPRFVRRQVEGEEGGLSCMVEGRDGRLWFGTALGVVRLDPRTGQARRFTVDDGLMSNSITLCERDGSGNLWFSDYSGLSRFEGRAERPYHVEEARLREIRIAGAPIPLPVNGARSIEPLTIPPNGRRLSVEFFAVHQGPGPQPRFQYRLEGSDPDWSAPTSDRSVHYASLSPGRHRFLVRTVGENGSMSGEPAVVALHVLAPIWQRPWFLAVCLGAVAGIVYATHRVRIGRALAAERIRTRIATDLHDDIGSSLSQISILSQLAHRQVGEAGGSAPETLERITIVSGEVIDAMSDVVWAISPRWDTVSALVHRMRRFASELFPDGTVALALLLPEADEVPVDADVRRQLYLVFKEALHNVRRHAAARHVTVELRRTAGAGWFLRIEEDGTGFDPHDVGEGHGMRSIRRRAERLGGTLRVRSSPQGTRLELTLPAR
jgi:ligand-binding sensor domain-containing protein